MRVLKLTLGKISSANFFLSFCPFNVKRPDGLSLRPDGCGSCQPAVPRAKSGSGHKKISKMPELEQKGDKSLRSETSLEMMLWLHHSPSLMRYFGITNGNICTTVLIQCIRVSSRTFMLTWRLSRIQRTVPSSRLQFVA
jgi:hypothetical protein